MPFIKNAVDRAMSAMDLINPSFSKPFAIVIRFLSCSPDASPELRGSNPPAIGSEDYVAALAEKFAKGRALKAPKPPLTIPDDISSLILQHYFGIAADRLEEVKREHQLSMVAENMVGELLERYLATVLEPLGWTWCSGSVVKAVDFLKAPARQGERWRMLQVKNRDNSENSSSSAIRSGTNIEKWFRTFSRRQGSNWDAFPDTDLRGKLSEKGFGDFIRSYLTKFDKLS